MRRLRSAALPLLLLVSALAPSSSGVGCGGTRACKEGTLFVTIDLGDTAATAGDLRIEVSVDMEPPTVATRRRSDVTHQIETVEIQFPNGYPVDKPVRVQVTALEVSTPIGASSVEIDRLPAGCHATTIEISRDSPAGTGGTGGGGAGRAGTSGSTGGAVGGRGGSGGSVGGTGGSGPTNCLMGLSTPPGTTLITDFSDAAPDTQSAGDIRFGASRPLHGGTARFASVPTNKGTLTLAGGALTFSAAVETPTATNMFPYNGFALYIDGPACVNASAYQGVQFTLSNVTGTCPILFRMTDSAHSLRSGDPDRGACASDCYAGGFPVVAGTMQIPFAAMPPFAGNPAASVDPAKLTDVQFQFQPAGSTGCSGSFTVDDIRFYGSAGGTGGTGGAGGAGGTAGTGGTSGSACGATFAVNPQGHVTAPMAGGACWRGPAYVNADPGSPVTPANFSACGTPCVLRMTGTVGAATMANNFAGYAQIGLNVAQDFGSPTVGSIAPTGTGVTVVYEASTGGLGMRLQISAGSTIWCANMIGPSPVAIPWANFRTNCWDTAGGTNYTKQPLNSMALLVLGGATSTPNVSLTLTSISETP